MNKLKFAIIGCGRISYKHVEAILDNNKKTELVALCDIIPQRGMEKAQQYINNAKVKGLKVKPPELFTDYNALLYNKDIEVIAIATESGKHAKIAIEAIKAKKHVIIEKPIALSTSEADEIAVQADLHNVKVCVCHQNRFNPTIKKLREAVDLDRFGKIIGGNARILWNRNENYYKQATWRGTYLQDGGCLMNQCIHNIDLLQWMLGGKISYVSGMVGNFMHPYIEAEDYGSIQLRFEDGAIGNVEGTVCVYPRNLEETLTIIGNKGMAVIGGVALNEIKVWQFSDSNDTQEEVQIQCNKAVENIYGSGHTPLYEDMIDSIINDRKPLIDAREGMKAMQIILCGYESNSKKAYVEFEKSIRTVDFI